MGQFNVSHAQREDYGLIKKNTVSDVDLLKDSNYTYTRILVTGDIQQENTHLQAAFNKDSNAYIYTNWFKQIRPVLFVGDIVIGNLETTFSGPPYSGTQYYSAPDDFLRILKRSGFNVLLNANDKITDFEGYGISRTLNKLDEIGFRHTGAFRSKQEKENTYPLILKVHNIKVAILNYTSQVKKQVFTEELYNKLSLSQVKQDINHAKSQGADYIIVYMHWGNEFEAKVIDYQRSIANTCIELGADAIIGSHPHIFQPVEIRQIKKNNKEKKAIIAYSLGDFLPASNDPKYNNSAILEIQLKKNNHTGEVSVEDYGYIPIWTQIQKNNFTVLPITNIDEGEILNIKLNFKEYSEAKTALNVMRGIMFERMDEIHYNISDKIVEDVDQTYLLLQDNPSLSKVAEKKVKDTLTKAQIAYIELFGTKEQKEKLNERFKSNKEIEDARLLAFKSQIKKREINRKALEEVVATFNKPVFEPQQVRPQVATEKYNIRKTTSFVKAPKPIMQIMEINQSEMVYSYNLKNQVDKNTIPGLTKKEPIIQTARKNNFQDYPKTAAKQVTAAVSSAARNQDSMTTENIEYATEAESAANQTIPSPAENVPAHTTAQPTQNTTAQNSVSTGIAQNSGSISNMDATYQAGKMSNVNATNQANDISNANATNQANDISNANATNQANSISNVHATNQMSLNSETPAKGGPIHTISKNDGSTTISNQTATQSKTNTSPLSINNAIKATDKTSVNAGSSDPSKNKPETTSSNILPAAIYNAMNQQNRKTERTSSSNIPSSGSNIPSSGLPVVSSNTPRPTPTESIKQTFTTKIVSQVVDTSGKVQTVIRKLEVVSNKPTPNLPYRPKVGGGIFTSQEPTPQETTTPKTYTDPNKTIAPTVTKTTIPDDIIYCVQVYAFTEKYIINTDLNPSLKYHEIVIEEGQYKYLVGKSRDMLQVSKLCQELREKGYTDAFMVKYVNGKRVPFVGN